MKFSQFQFNTDYLYPESVKTITYRNKKGQNCDINVKTYLPVSDKIDLIQIAMQKAEEDGIYNQIKLDVYFHLNIVYLYTDIEFEQEDKEDEMKLYDILESNDIIDQVVAAIGEGEYGELREYLETMESDVLAYKNTAAAVLTRIIQDLPKNAAIAKDIVDSFDQEKYQSVVDFATAANGGRNIVTNLPVDKEGDALSPAASQKVVELKKD